MFMIITRSWFGSDPDYRLNLPWFMIAIGLINILAGSKPVQYTEHILILYTEYCIQCLVYSLQHILIMYIWYLYNIHMSYILRNFEKFFDVLMYLIKPEHILYFIVIP